MNLAARFAQYDLLSDADRQAIDAERMLPVDELRRILSKIAAGFPIHVARGLPPGSDDTNLNNPRRTMKNIHRAIAAIAIIAGVALSPAAVEARANNCQVWYRSNSATVQCTGGNHGDVYYMRIKCRKNYWWGGSHTVEETGNVARVGFIGSQASSYVKCQTGYSRINGGTIVTP